MTTLKVQNAEHNDIKQKSEREPRLKKRRPRT